MLKKFSPRLLFTLVSLILLGGSSCTQASAGETEAIVNTGDTAWVLASTALVLFMTLPALALFYAGWYARKMSCLF